MAKAKTHKTGVDVTGFINSVDDERKRADSFRLIKIMSEETGLQPYMWGPTIIGFGNYHYKYGTGHEGNAPLAGFSPRRSAISLYFAANFPGRDELLAQFGKYKAAVSCIYVKNLDDISLPVLKKIIAASVKHIKSSIQ